MSPTLTPRQALDNLEKVSRLAPLTANDRDLIIQCIAVLQALVDTTPADPDPNDSSDSSEATPAEDTTASDDSTPEEVATPSQDGDVAPNTPSAEPEA